MTLKKTVLITGSEGFLGKEVCRIFREDPGYKIITTDKIDGADIVGDLSSKDFVNSLPDCNVVVNCAAVQYVTKGKPLFFKRRFFYENNVAAIENLIGRYSAIQGHHFIHVGTSMVYRMTGQHSYSEQSELTGQGIYSESKLEAQKRLSDAKVVHSVVVPCIIGGAGRAGLFKDLIRSIRSMGLALIPGTGQNQTSIVHKHDVASLIKVIADLRSEGVYNAAAVDAMSFNGWAELIADKINKKLRIVNLPLSPIKFVSKLTNYNLLAREQLYMLEFSHVLDVQKSLGLGWKPKYTVPEIIDEIVANEH